MYTSRIEFLALLVAGWWSLQRPTEPRVAENVWILG
jgi:hypothetical protein